MYESQSVEYAFTSPVGIGFGNVLYAIYVSVVYNNNIVSLWKICICYYIYIIGFKIGLAAPNPGYVVKQCHMMMIYIIFDWHRHN